jgi:hypothetical protein
MAVALVDRGIGRQAIEVLVAVDVVDPGAFAARDDHVEGVVVVGAVLLFQVDEGLRWRWGRHGDTCA